MEISALRENIERLVEETGGLCDHIESAVESVRRQVAHLCADELADADVMAPLLQFAVATLISIRDRARDVDVGMGALDDASRPSWSPKEWPTNEEPPTAAVTTPASAPPVQAFAAAPSAVTARPEPEPVPAAVRRQRQPPPPPRPLTPPGFAASPVGAAEPRTPLEPAPAASPTPPVVPMSPVAGAAPRPPVVQPAPAPVPVPAPVPRADTGVAWLAAPGVEPARDRGGSRVGDAAGRGGKPAGSGAVDWLGPAGR